MTPIRPPKLRRGDLIGVITPASPVADSIRIETGVQYLQSLGYRTKIGEHVGKTLGYLAGTDDERVADIHSMFADNEVKAIICLRGGYGTPRLLSMLDYRLIARNPKILVGYSDITALQCALWSKCGLVTFHGPMAAVEMAKPIDPYTEELFWRLLTSTKKPGRLPLPTDLPVQTSGNGTARGRLIGGNLALLLSVLATPFEPSFTDALLFLEDVEEAPYRVDRMMSQLQNARIFKRVRGVLLGQFTDCVPTDPTKPSLTIEEVLADATEAFGGPTLGNLPFGHVPRKFTLPFGVLAEINIEKKELALLEPAVS
ncbi:MAG: LD-carboxypeptidase [Ignavibacteriae bacterium]|nr:LD-carboxypeptidase [Ignavibacteriota bacterium]